MKCPNCNYAFENSNICPNCEIDTVLFAKTTLVSGRLYNKGLNQIKAGDLSGAIESLIRSIEFNKVNSHSRNLLGLVYFEIGMIGDALKHWIISANYDKENNLAEEYIKRLQDDTATLERLNDAVEMYNQAIIYLEQNSGHMAIIQLEKAVEYNPKFLKAQNLLAVMYLVQEENRRASDIVKKVLSIDVTNELAIRYSEALNINGDEPEKANIVVKEKTLFQKLHISKIIALIVGVLCTVAAFEIFIIPSSSTTQLDDVRIASSQIEQQYQRILAERDEYLQHMIEEVERLKELNVQLNVEREQELDLYIRMSQINIVLPYILEELYEEARYIIDSINMQDFPWELLQSIEMIREEIYQRIEYNNE